VAGDGLKRRAEIITRLDSYLGVKDMTLNLSFLYFRDVNRIPLWDFDFFLLFSGSSLYQDQKYYSVSNITQTRYISSIKVVAAPVIGVPELAARSNISLHN
jgi:hypothetical protein